MNRGTTISYICEEKVRNEYDDLVKTKILGQIRMTLTIRRDCIHECKVYKIDNEWSCGNQMILLYLLDNINTITNYRPLIANNVRSKSTKLIYKFILDLLKI